jgi:hypothetical protein
MGKMLQINNGDKFYRLTVLRELSRINQPSGQSPRRFEFLCDCGNVIESGLHWVRNGNVKSCGCYATEVRKSSVAREKSRVSSTKHGMSDTRTYRSWQQMRGRCENKNHHKFALYGGRGVTVCPRWSKFEIFFQDMGERPEKSSIGRIDNNGNYCKENCRWELSNQQMRNTSYTKLITHNGETLCQTDWAKRLGLAPHTLVARKKRGWTIEAIVTTPRWQRGERKD